MDELLAGLGKAIGTMELGSVADWVTGLLTALALFVAIRVFQQDKRNRERAQSLLLKSARGFETGDILKFRYNFVFEVQNNSQLPFTDVWLYYRPSPTELFERVNDYRSQASDEWDATGMTLFRFFPWFRDYLKDYPRYASKKLGTIPAGEAAIFVLPDHAGTKTRIIDFRDAEGRQMSKIIGTNRFVSQRRMRSIRNHGRYISSDVRVDLILK
ncbi:hypothetical protein [Rathayibacter festucae]|uniref:hypothetical protein n=1 Tax=Rathayibacter festucae TaxID=110937 RepID=UPI000FD820E4|nr:hypothetical protein [Rathayibacter festucae]